MYSQTPAAQQLMDVYRIEGLKQNSLFQYLLVNVKNQVKAQHLHFFLLNDCDLVMVTRLLTAHWKTLRIYKKQRTKV